jgi:folate-binding protein YgfZ
MFIRQQDDVFFIDCESGARAQDLAKTLTMYRLRSDVGLSVTEDIRVYAVFGAAEGLPDPRHDALGNRLYQDAPDALDMGGFDDYDRLRIRLALPDGSRDGVVGESTLAELNISELAVSYTKGCFIGQELTARLHNMGHAKKHLYPLKLNGPAPAFQAEIIDINGHYIGHMRSSNGDLGLACIKDDSLQSIPPALGEILS